MSEAPRTHVEGAIVVLYSCHGCHVTDRPVAVLEREPGTPIEAWMTQLRAALGAHHREHSPGCASRVCDLKIPMTGRHEVGGPVRQ